MNHLSLLSPEKPQSNISNLAGETVTVVLPRRLLKPLREIVLLINEQDRQSTTYIANIVYGDSQERLIMDIMLNGDDLKEAG